MLNVLKFFSGFDSKGNSTAAVKKAPATPTIEELAQCPLFQDIGSEQFYVLMDGPRGTAKRVYLSNEQVRAMMG